MLLRTCAVALSLVAVASLPLRAQTSDLNTIPDSASVTTDSAKTTGEVTRAAPVPATSGASMTGLRAGVHLRETSRPSQPNALATRANLGQARAMMVVGVAALFAGAIIGGDPGTIVMVGGAVIGLIGLYDYLQ
jgi:hypothetical protein